MLWHAEFHEEYGNIGMRFRTVYTAVIAIALASMALTACGPAQEEFNPDQSKRKRVDGSVSGGGLKGLFGSGDGAPGAGTGDGSSGGIGVNSYLWRASLDTISFMPVASADPFGGVIITDWYAPSDNPDERLKINLYILGRELSANGLRASVFRQVKQNGTWVDAKVGEKTARELENAVLARARELRMSVRN